MPRDVTWPLLLRPPVLRLPSVSALTGLPFQSDDLSTRMSPRRAGEVGLYCLSAIVLDPARNIDGLALGEGDDGLFDVRTRVGLALPALRLALGDHGVDAGHADIEQRFDGSLDLRLGRALRDTEDDRILLRKHGRFLGDVRRQDDVV